MKQAINYKRIAELAAVYVTTVLFVWGGSLIVGKYGQGLPVNLLLIISEVIIILPTLIYCIIRKLNFREDLGFRKIKVSTVFLSILAGFLVMPIASFVNVLTQFFVPNTMVQASETLLSGSKIIMLLITGLLAPFCEEVIFRGLFHREFTKHTTPLLGIILSAVLFGIIHLNINQLCYALVLGLIFAWVNNCSRSTYSSFIMHAVINTTNTLMIIIVSYAYDFLGESMVDSTEAIRGDKPYLTKLAITYFIVGTIGLILTKLCTKAIKKNEMPEAAKDDIGDETVK